MMCGLCSSCPIAFLALQYGGFAARQRLAATGLFTECLLSLGAMHVVGSHHVNIALRNGSFAALQKSPPKSTTEALSPILVPARELHTP